MASPRAYAIDRSFPLLNNVLGTMLVFDILGNLAHLCKHCDDFLQEWDFLPVIVGVLPLELP